MGLKSIIDCIDVGNLTSLDRQVMTHVAIEVGVIRFLPKVHFHRPPELLIEMRLEFWLKPHQDKVADEIGKSPSQVALNWVRQQPGVIIPIIGAKTEKQLKDNLECLNFTLSEEHMKQLSEASKIDMGFPHDFLTSETIVDIIYGGTKDKIDNHHKF